MVETIKVSGGSKRKCGDDGDDQSCDGPGFETENEKRFSVEETVFNMEKMLENAEIELAIKQSLERVVLNVRGLVVPKVQDLEKM